MKKVAYLIIGILSISTFALSWADTKSNDVLMAELIAAEMYCFSLEDLIFKHKSNFKSRNSVYEFFQQGFGPSISERLTDNIWNNNQIMLRAGDKIMEPAKNVSFSNVTPDSANISFETPLYRKHIWGSSTYTELIFKKEAGRWKLFEKGSKR